LVLRWPRTLFMRIALRRLGNREPRVLSFSCAGTGRLLYFAATVEQLLRLIATRLDIGDLG